jgi:pathogenesis-related protein 1
MYKKISIKIALILVTATFLTVPLSVLQVSYAQTNQDLESSILDVHNQERAAVGVQPLTWSNSLANDAQTWAQQIATTGIFNHLDNQHTGPTCTGPCYGENIAGFFTSVSEPNGGQSRWAAEKSSYNGQTNTCTAVCGHYTQMVWQATTEVGCATAPPGAGGLQYSILLCRYSPPGNYPGQLPYGAAAPPADQGAAAPPADQGAAAPPADQGGDGGGNEN